MTAQSPDRPLTEAQIKFMVDRFLSWKLPRDAFNPDCGISFDKKPFNTHTPHPMVHEPSGTNLFSAQQATAMVRHMVEGMQAAFPVVPSPDREALDLLQLQQRGRARAFRLLDQGRTTSDPTTLAKADAYERCGNELKAILALPSVQVTPAPDMAALGMTRGEIERAVRINMLGERAITIDEVVRVKATADVIGKIVATMEWAIAAAIHAGHKS